MKAAGWHSTFYTWKWMVGCKATISGPRRWIRVQGTLEGHEFKIEDQEG